MNLKDKVTVFLIATEKERNYKEAKEALNNQSCEFVLDEILDFEPLHNACNQMIDRCKTPFFCQIDEDMILYPTTIENMYNTIKTMPSNVAMVRFKLFDKYLEKIIGSVIIHNTEIAKQFRWKNVPQCDLERHNELKNAGYIIITKNETIGVHHPHWDLLSIFRKFVIRSEKVKKMKIKDDIFLQTIIDKIKNNISELDLFALFGYFMGLFYNSTTEKDYSTLLVNEFDTIYKVFGNQLKKKYNYYQFITMEKNNLVKKLKDYIDLEIVNSIEKIKNSNKPVILWNGHTKLKVPSTAWKGELINWCKENNRTYYIFERGALPNSLFLDKNGFLYNSTSYQKENWNKPLSEEEQHKINEYIENFKNDFSTLEKQYNEKLNIPCDSNVIFVPFQVQNDTVMQLWSDWIVDQKHYYSAINNLAKNLPNHTFLVKNHPVQIDKRFPLFNSDLPNIINVDNIHYKNCIDKADVVLTINSGVGLQAMMWNKPVLILGKSFYQFDEINKKINSFKELYTCLKHKPYYKPDYNMVRQFLYYLQYNFYTNGKLVKTGINSSNLEYIKRLVFESPYNNKKIIQIFNEIPQTKELDSCEEFLSILNKKYIYPCFLNESCLNVVNHKQIKNVIYVNCEISKQCKNDLIDAGFIVTEKVIYKNNFKIYISKNKPEKTKKWHYGSYEIKVPLPVVSYLSNLFGKDWSKK